MSETLYLLTCQLPIPTSHHDPDCLEPVERCEHGNIDPHELGHVNPPWCPGSPTLAEADDASR